MAVSSDNFDNEPSPQTGEQKLEKLKSMAETVEWQIPIERFKFYHRFMILINGWHDHLPDLETIFKREEIEALFIEAIQTEVTDPVRFFKFVLLTGYEDEPDFDEDGNHKLRRKTPIHRACGTLFEDEVVPLLFRIYSCFEANYIDDEGLTHFQVAIEVGCVEAVKQFLEHGQDANRTGDESGESPLHIAVSVQHESVVRLLLAYGADPNQPNNDGMTPLHTAYGQHESDHELKKIFEVVIDFCEQANKPVKIDAVDDRGRTPLEMAVVNRLPNVIDVLVDHGADLSGFVFPSINDYADCLALYELDGLYRFKLVSGILVAIERLQDRGYKLKRSEARMIMTLFWDKLLFDTSQQQLDDSWRDDKDFRGFARFIALRKDYTLLDLTRLPPVEPTIPLTYEDYFELSHMERLRDNEESPWFDSCMIHLCEHVSARFFQQWARQPFLQLAGHMLSDVCCKMIVENLESRDLLSICAASEIFARQNWA